MTDNLLLLGMLAGIVVSIVLFFLQRRGTFEHVLLGVGVLMVLTTFTMLMLQQRSEAPQTAFGTDQQPDVATLLLPSTVPETQVPLTPTATPEESAASATTLDTSEPRLNDDEPPSVAPEALVRTVRAEVANVRRDPTPTSPIVGTVTRDDELIVVDTQQGWYLVRLGEGHAPQSVLRSDQGWIWGELVNAPKTSE